MPQDKMSPDPRHVLPNTHERYPGLAHLNDYSWWQMILIAAVPCKSLLACVRLDD